MARTRKLTLSVREFRHLVSESLDATSAIRSSQSFVDNTAVFSEVSQQPHNRQSSFHRIFSRPTPARHDDSPEEAPEDRSETPRKMIAWPFSRSPRKNQPTGDEDNATDVRDPDVGLSVSPYSVTSPAAISTSSLGSLLPAHERLFQVSSRDSHEQSCNCKSSLGVAAPSLAAPARTREPPTGSDYDAAPVALNEIFGSGSASSLLAGSNHGAAEPASDVVNQSRTSFTGTEASHSMANSVRESVDGDPTPQASTFGPRAAFPHPETRDDPAHVQGLRSRRHPVVVPPRNVDILALRPAVGVAPHVPSATESSTSLCSTLSLASTAARPPSPVLPTRPSGTPAPSPRVPPLMPPNPRIAAMIPDTALPSNAEPVPAVGFSPRQRKRAMSRSMTPPPLPRPPPMGPLPAVPLSVPPVPPLPPLLQKMPMNATSHSVPSSSPRSTVVGAPATPPTALPPSPPGGLRLPSRLSWVNSVRAVLPSPPASPTRSLKSLAGKTSPPHAPLKTEKGRPNELKRPTSIGVIEAADNVQVRRTKSILLLGSRSKSNASLGAAKRVQIHADVSPDADESRKPRRKSSAPVVSHPVCSSDAGFMVTPMPSAELLVPRERRHSVPLLSSMEPLASADWTLSLPFCTDVPGNKILPSPLSTPKLKLEDDLKEVDGEDWTLCMPLKVRVDSATVGTASTEGCDSSDSTLAKSPEEAEVQSAAQLPTPSPSPTWSMPSSATRPLEPEEESVVSLDRPASPASLGPHAGGLDLAGGRGKRASGWHVYGWFEEVNVPEPEDERDVTSPPMTPTTLASVARSAESKPAKNHVIAFRKVCCDAASTGRQPSQDSTSTVSTSGMTFYSARSSLLVN